MKFFHHLIFDFNSVLLFAEKPSAEVAGEELLKIEVPESWSKAFYLNTELLGFAQRQKQNGLTVSVLSASEYSLYQPKVKAHVEPYFDHFFLTKDLGWPKDLPATYLQLAEALQTKPEQMLFIDDKLAHVQAAEMAGATAFHYTSNTELLRAISKVLP